MVDKIPVPAKSQDESPAVADLSESTAASESIDAKPLNVTNEEMAEHFKPATGQVAPQGAGELGGGATGLSRPGDKFLPAFELDFGVDVDAEAPARGGDGCDAVDQCDAADQCDAGEVVEKDKEPTLSRDGLQELAKETLKSPEMLADFQNRIEVFEKRAVAAGLTQQDREEFYGQVGRVLNESKTGNGFYDSKDLQTIASDMVRHAARPGSVNQGKSSTCTTAALETALYIQEPATISRMVSDVALTGQYEKVDGTIVKVPERNLHPDKYKANTPAEKARSLASHIAQPELINIHWSEQDEYAGQSGKKGAIVYEEGHPTAFIGDSHTRMMDYSKTPPVPFTETVSESDPTIENVGIAVERQQAIEGPSMQMDYLQGVYKQLRGNKGDLTIINHQEGDGVIKPESREHLKQILKDAHDRKKPVIMGVFANRGPFLDDLNESYSGKPLTEQEKKMQERMHAHHALVATDLDPSSGLVTVENQWGDRVDHTGQEGQKAKLDLDTVFDTVREKPAAPEAADAPERAKPTPEDWMRQQREFVEKLESDKDVDPQVMFEARMTLRRYLNHWGHNGEAKQQDKLLAEGLSERLRSGKEDASLMGDVEIYLLGSKDCGGSEHMKHLLAAADGKFKTTPSTDKEYSRKFQEHLKIHTLAEDTEGAGRLAHDVVTRFLQVHNTPESIANKESRNQLSSLVDTLEANKIPQEASRVADAMLANLRNYEGKYGSEHREVVAIKSTLSFLGEQNSFPEMKATLAKEMKESYQRLKEKGDISSEASMTLRFSLNHIYEQTRNPRALNELLHDGFDYLTTHGGRGGKYEPDSKEMIGPYTYAADRLVRAGGKEFAIPLMERALEIAKAKDPERVETIATDLVHRLDSLGRSADADRIVKETGVKVHFRRTNERKASNK